MGKLSVRDFVPPIVFRTYRFFERRFKKGNEEGPRLHHPFDAVPRDIDVKWIMDVGANVGDVTTVALWSYPKANVICFEPVKGTFEILKEKLKDFTAQTHLFNMALSNSAGEGEINITTSNGANSIETQSASHQALNPHVREVGKEKIRLVRLDEIASQLPAQKIDILKIDVEGHELAVLEGGANFISKNVNAIIIEVSIMRDQAGKHQSLFDLFAVLNKMGFQLYNIIDLHHTSSDLSQLIQMDCIFRNRKFLSNH